INLPPSPSLVSQQPKHQVTVPTTTDGVIAAPAASVNNSINDVASVINNDIAPNNSTTPDITTHAHVGKSFPRKFTDGAVPYNPNQRASYSEPTSHQ
nr:hypothetical protein [Tanacetum cinerariifolium]